MHQHGAASSVGQNEPGLNTMWIFSCCWFVSASSFTKYPCVPAVGSGYAVGVLLVSCAVVAKFTDHEFVCLAVAPGLLRDPAAMPVAARSSMSTTPIVERRRRDLLSRVARATYPSRMAFDGFIAGFPCNVAGHKWVEVPETLRRSGRSDGRRIRFSCHRCGMVGGFGS